MILRLLSSIICICIFVSCAAYKELKPDPELRNVENNYIELKDGDEYFELDEGDKYFFNFPPPLKENIYLVLEIKPKEFITADVSETFTDKEGAIKKLTNITHDSDILCVYALKKNIKTYYWVIEEVLKDIVLEMKYRYVAAWRYKFEVAYVKMQEQFQSNLANHDLYKNLGISIEADNVQLDSEINSLNSKTENLQKIQTDLKNIESLFPEDIKDTGDEAYLNFVQFSKNVKEELVVHSNLKETLDLLKFEKTTRKDVKKLASELSRFVVFLKAKDKFPKNIRDAVSKVVSKRLQEVYGYFENELIKKADESPIELLAHELKQLYSFCGLEISAGLEKMTQFVHLFNQSATAYANGKKEIENIKSSVKNKKSWPEDSFYSSLSKKMSEVSATLPSSKRTQYESYKGYKCVDVLSASSAKLSIEANNLTDDYDLAGDIVKKINKLKAEFNYREIIKTLKEYSRLEFLQAHYSDVDQLSLKQQQSGIYKRLETNDFAGVEQKLQELFNDTYFLNPAAVQSAKMSIVTATEDTIMNRIERISKKRALGFVENNVSTVMDVDQLYLNPAFDPVHEMTFTTKNKDSFIQRKQKLQNVLSNLKYDVFPSRAIESLYEKFIRDIKDNGVDIARTIASHGKYYKGDNQKIKNLAAECDPGIAKWLTKAASYRKIYAVPVTSNPNGINEYLIRANIKIPSEARFPVFDVNIKLPKTIAARATQEQWYESMKINNDILKNEGRFTITAPTAENNYECQATPVQMQKGKDNIFEIRFKHNSYQVHEISLMAQKPIIRKN